MEEIPAKQSEFAAALTESGHDFSMVAEEQKRLAKSNRIMSASFAVGAVMFMGALSGQIGKNSHGEMNRTYAGIDIIGAGAAIGLAYDSAKKAGRLKRGIESSDYLANLDSQADQHNTTNAGNTKDFA
jgi:hypothetical protein